MEPHRLYFDDQRGVITSPATPHTAHRGQDRDAWYVTWLPYVRLDRNQAITAMTIAAERDTLALDALNDLAGELGLTRVDVTARFNQHTLV